jgi:hypothetical protein
MTMFTTFSFLISSAILFFVLRYRVHVHVTYTLPVSPRGIRSPMRSQRATDRSSLVAPGRQAEATTNCRPVQADVESALINLGCKKLKAREIAARACREHQDFEGALRLAIQEAA